MRWAPDALRTDAALVDAEPHALIVDTRLDAKPHAFIVDARLDVETTVQSTHTAREGDVLGVSVETDRYLRPEAVCGESMDSGASTCRNTQ